jgi:hypothetical protein
LSGGAISVVRPELRAPEPYGWVEWLGTLLARELAPSRRKLRLGLRITTIGTLGAALIAICHVNNQLGAYLVWLLVGAGPMLTVRKAGMLLILEAAALAGSVVMARALAETPWLMLAFIFFLFSSSTYIGNKLKLGTALLLVQVVSFDLFYGVVFSPAAIGWAAAGSFGGTVIAVGLVVLFDNCFWPEYGEPLLLEALAASIARARSRLVGAADFYLGRRGALRPPVPPPTSDLPVHIGLLDQVVTEGIDPYRHAILVAAITRVARISLEVDRLMIAARESVPGEMQGLLGVELQAAVDAIARALDEIARELRTEILVGPDRPAPPSRTRARMAMDALSARTVQVRPVYIVRATPAELEHFAAFTDPLAALTAYIERLLDEPPQKKSAPRLDHAPSPKAAPVDPALVRYSLKVGLCAIVGYVIGIFTQKADLSTILTTVLITALPTYGAAFRKMVLRIVGALIGGAISLLAIIIVSPNFATLPAYMLAIFVVFYISAYSSLSSGRVAYAGKQIGTTFALVFAGLSPSVDIYGPLWRIWGILLGTFVVAVIALILWPEYAGDSLLPRLRRVIADTLALAPGGAASTSEDAINETNSDTMRALAEILEVADDAQLEGRTSTVDHNAMVEAAGTLRRIANRLASISALRVTVPTPALDSITESARAAELDEIRRQLKLWLDFFSGPTSQCLSAQAARALARGLLLRPIDEPLTEFAARIEEHQYDRIAPWTLDQRRAILSEINSLRRITVLLPQLNLWLARIPGRL